MTSETAADLFIRTAAAFFFFSHSQRAVAPGSEKKKEKKTHRHPSLYVRHQSENIPGVSAAEQMRLTENSARYT